MRPPPPPAPRAATTQPLENSLRACCDGAGVRVGGLSHAAFLAARPHALETNKDAPPPLAPSAPPLCNRLCPRISLLCAPFHAGHAGSFEVLREKGETEAQLWERSKKKAKGGAYGL